MRISFWSLMSVTASHDSDKNGIEERLLIKKQTKTALSLSANLESLLLLIL